MSPSTALTPRTHPGQLANLVTQGAHILDLGCGSGELLSLLLREKDCHGLGIDRDSEAIQACITQGLPAFQDDLLEALKDYPDKTFDVVILNHTLQAVDKPLEVLKAMSRVGQRCLLGFPNFGHWAVRFNFFRTGRMPESDALPHSWHDTPNIHLFTYRDFRVACQQLGLSIQRQRFWVNAPGLPQRWQANEPFPGFANWFGDSIIVEVSTQ